MPRTLLDQQGNEVEVPTEEEIKALEEKAGTADTLATELETLKGDKNFRVLRNKAEKYDKIKEAAEADGKTIDDEGKIIETTKAPTAEEYAAIARKEAIGTILGNHLNTKLAAIADEGQRNALKIKYDKLAAGEDITEIAQVDKIFDEAQKVIAVPPVQGQTVVQGSAPVKADNVELSETATQLGQALGMESTKMAGEADKK